MEVWHWSKGSEKCNYWGGEIVYLFFAQTMKLKREQQTVHG
jgi:hypothetical protein